jgi:uncharacterized protein YwqG
MKELKLPKELEPLRDKIEATRQDYVKLIYTPCADEDLSLTQSKMGGYPYMPPNFEYPLDVQGKKMILIAQINFAEVPPLENFPTEGILQFFITNNDRLGMHDEYKEGVLTQKHFRVLYHPTIDARQPESVLTDIPTSSPANAAIFVTQACALTFEKKTEFVPAHGFDAKLCFGGYDLEEYISEELFPELDYQEVEELSEQYKAANGEEFLDDTLGGYAYVIQGDIRNYHKSHLRNYQQLLQMSTQRQAGILHFASAASAHLFIAPEDLKKCDFSKVVYTWNCG